MIRDCGGEAIASGGVAQAEIQELRKDGNDQPDSTSHPKSTCRYPPVVSQSQPEATSKGAFRKCPLHRIALGVEISRGKGGACL